MSHLLSDERAVSVPMNYVLMMGIVAVLAVGLILGTGGFVKDQQEGAARSGLEVVGNRVATDLSTADRLAETLDTGSVEVTTDLPGSIAGTTYRIEIIPVEERTDTDPNVNLSHIVITTTDPEVSVTIPVRTRHAIRAGSVDGGRLIVSFDEVDTLEVQSA